MIFPVIDIIRKRAFNAPKQAVDIRLGKPNCNTSSGMLFKLCGYCSIKQARVAFLISSKGSIILHVLSEQNKCRYVLLDVVPKNEKFCAKLPLRVFFDVSSALSHNKTNLVLESLIYISFFMILISNQMILRSYEVSRNAARANLIEQYPQRLKSIS